MRRFCCSKLHAILFPARVPLSASQMSNKNAISFGSKLGGGSMADL